ncbi:MAG: histone-lysine N-methyltransferase [Spirochaetes bacterium]|nr:histone-lysine N-methyltransferase [Spirochaetota bacterium]MBN2770191.1 histone-lysine N-methyltransferase [Spirochaetota bacterium]
MLKSISSYSLVEPDEPALYREQFPFTKIPRILFDSSTVFPSPPKELWITDTTFRDGQQSRPPYTPGQIADIFTLLHKLGGQKGLIRQSEFFIYSDRDRQAVELCLEKGYQFPEVTSWIRADKKDFALVKSFNLKETGILTSVSDYHIFLKLKRTREKTMNDYLEIVQTSIEHGIVPRCHFEDITRADIYGFCLPFAEKLLRIAEEAKMPVKIRLCDTMGYGVTFPGAVLPRSVPKMVDAFHSKLGYPAEWLEWHGHNDFHKVHVNAATAWLYGCASVNASLLGYGERTGNPPLEAAVIEYMSLTGDDSIDTRVITEIARYFEQTVKAEIPANYPFVGADFNTTRAGIHADGILKNQEIYNIFDTDALLNRPIRVMVTDKSGLAGIAQWLNENIPAIVAGEREQVSKRHPGIKHINNWVMQQYEQGRTTSISPDELLIQARHFIPSLFESEFDSARNEAIAIGKKIAEKIATAPEVESLEVSKLEDFLEKIVKKEGSIQMLAVTNTDGYRLTQVHTQHGEKALFRNLMNKDFKNHVWFCEVLEKGEAYYSDLFFSKYTKRLIITAAVPIKDKSGNVKAVMDVDFIFNELVKLITDIPDEIIDERSDKKTD